ncbi:hypothetical protein V6N13_016338 [Hibiscus sabdariffa]
MLFTDINLYTASVPAIHHTKYHLGHPSNIIPGLLENVLAVCIAWEALMIIDKCIDPPFFLQELAQQQSDWNRGKQTDQKEPVHVQLVATMTSNVLTAYVLDGRQ